MNWKLLLAMVAVAILSVGCGTTTVNPSAVIDFNGLHWQVGPDEDMTWYEAKEWVDGLEGDWRMPIQEELRGLWDAGISRSNWGPFENNGWSIWSGEAEEGRSAAWLVEFDRGSGCWYGFSTDAGTRVFAVHSRYDIAYTNSTEGQNVTIASENAGFEFNGLYWQVCPDEDMTWYEAKEWVDGLEGDWRMPIQEELRGLWDAGISRSNWGPFENNGWFIWSGEVRDSSSAWYFGFDYGSGRWTLRSYSYNRRTFAVRRL